METNIYFIRHAHSPFIYGQERKRPLSKEGRESATKLVNSLQDISFDTVLSSPYTRSLQTLEGLIDPSKIIVKEDLRERTLKGNYKLPENEIELAIKKSFEDLDFRLEGGETVREAQCRSLPIIFKIIENPAFKNVAIGTHGNIMTCIMNYFDNSFGYTFWKSTEKPDTYKLTFNGYHLISVTKIKF
ncbi:histidine phosphatase family protein [Bacillus sp. 166amftsu]|uniref:histidine phosphatase family protein n=1 Tax=Bacillus sp. 166amftsu TaxID=1761753 RepID=UPI00089487D8|nr:histidine phosphatase family protein [Bacillus sp. 166amftsu]SDZ13873.1 2,3-bisphosphoglycerate-dependent phosphoglycerate mutase [Bacillus sp. 166amftsu]